jgi:hypothetical protein
MLFFIGQWFYLFQSFNYAPYLFYKKRFKSEINSFCIWTHSRVLHPPPAPLLPRYLPSGVRHGVRTLWPDQPKKLGHWRKNQAKNRHPRDHHVVQLKSNQSLVLQTYFKAFGKHSQKKFVSLYSLIMLLPCFGKHYK